MRGIKFKTDHMFYDLAYDLMSQTKETNVLLFPKTQFQHYQYIIENYL